MTKAELRSDDSAQPPLPDWQRQILDERIAADHAAPDEGSPWQEVKRRILGRLRA